MNKKGALKILIAASALAVLISLFLNYQHFSKEASKFCNFGAYFSCDIVNKGEYSTVDGVINLVADKILGGHHYVYLPVPNAVISLVVFLFILGGALRLQRKKSYFGMKDETVLKVLRVLVILGWVYAAILIFIEAEVLQTWCLFCLLLDMIMVLIAYALFAVGRER